MLERCNSTLSGNNITLNANNNIHTVGVDIQADNSISGNLGWLGCCLLGWLTDFVCLYTYEF
jgi:hypothetical protein